MKSSATTTTPLFLISLCLSPTLSLSSPDSHLLLAFKSSLPSPNTLQNWLPTTSPCYFTGVLCSQNRVSSINLNSVPLNIDFNSVSSTLFNLSNLQSLSLKASNLSGSVSSLSKTQCSPVLSSIDLAENELAGALSELSSFESCSGLKTVNLSSNLFDFSIVVSGKSGLNLGNLEGLDLFYNKISGENVVPWLFSRGCGGLSSLSLKGNRISGEVPVKACESLEYLDLSANNISSIFPDFGSCSVLMHLDLTSNKFFGDPSASLSLLEPHLSQSHQQPLLWRDSVDQFPGATTVPLPQRIPRRDSGDSIRVRLLRAH